MDVARHAADRPTRNADVGDLLGEHATNVKGLGGIEQVPWARSPLELVRALVARLTRRAWCVSLPGLGDRGPGGPVLE